MEASPFLTTNLSLPYETSVNFNGTHYPQPHWWLMLTNNLRVMMLEPISSGSISNRVIDYVQLRGPNSFRDLTAEIQTLNVSNLLGFNGLWVTTYDNGLNIPEGLANQVGVSLGLMVWIRATA